MMRVNIINKLKDVQYYSTFFLIAIACLSITFLWFYTNGYPFIHHNDESFLSYVHAWYLNFTNPFDFYFLTKEEPTKVYTHNPNLPRYFHYLLMKVGIINFTYQLLIISTLATSTTIALLYSALLKKIPYNFVVTLIVIFFIVSPQFIVHSHNTYRVFSFLLFSMMLYSILNNKNKLLFISAFLLFQYEYAFAIFLGMTFSIYLILNGLTHQKKLILYFLMGIFASILIFTTQVMSYLSFDELLTEIFEIVLPTRGSANRPFLGVIRTFREVIGKDNSIVWNLYFCCAFLSLFYIALINKKISKLYNKDLHNETLAFSSNLLLSIFVGGFLTTILLPGYCADAYGDYNFPFTIFHKTIVFTFIVCSIYVIFLKLLKNSIISKIRYLIVLIICYLPISSEIKASLTYLDPSKINRGKYLDIFKDYENKHYISNFWAGRIKNNKPRPLYPELAYGIEAINKAIVLYKDQHNVDKQDPFYYICVKQHPYNCDEMQVLINKKWGTIVIDDARDYLIIEFTPENLSAVSRKQLGITEEHWIELALKFISDDSFPSVINNINIKPDYDNSSIDKIYDTNINALNMLHAFRKSYDLARTAPSLDKIDKDYILYLQMRHPITWKPALLIGLSKYISEASGKEFTDNADVSKAYEYIETFIR